MKAKVILFLLLLCGFCRPAKAHRLNEYLQATTISLGRDSIRLRMDLTAGSDVAQQVLAEIDPNGDGIISIAEQRAYANLIGKGLLLNIDDRKAPLYLSSWYFPSEDEIKKGIGDIRLYFSAALAAVPAGHHLIFRNQRPGPTAVYLVNCLLPADTGIRVTGQSRNSDQSFYSLYFTTGVASTIIRADQQISLERSGNSATLKTYFYHGVKHILTGYDHLLFLCALVLGAAGLWDLIKIVTAFTIAHSITLTLAALGYAHLPAYIVEPLISASIVFVAVQNICWPQHANGKSRLAVAFFFGLFHGLGFAGGLLELMHAMPSSLIFYAILGFSLGVETGNQVVLLPLYGLLQGIKRVKTSKLPEFRRFASAAVAVFGVYYLIVALAG